MDEHGGSKLIGIRQIVRLKELLHKWQLVTLGPRDANGHHGHGHDHKDDHDENNGDENESGVSPLINKRLTEVITCDSDEESCHCSGPPADVPKGYLAVYVGPEHRRFIIPTSYLSHSLFKLLLEKTEEEFGFDHSGALTIPCEIETFKYLLKCMENHSKDNHHDDATSAGNSGTMEDGE